MPQARGRLAWLDISLPQRGAESKFEKGEDISGRMLKIISSLREIRQRGTPDMEFAVGGLLARSQIASDQSEDAYHTITTLREQFEERGLTRFLPNMDALLCRMDLLTGNWDKAEEWYRRKAPKDLMNLNVLTAIALHRKRDERWRERLTVALDAHGAANSPSALRRQVQRRDCPDHGCEAADREDPCQPHSRKAGCEAPGGSQDRREKAASGTGRVIKTTSGGRRIRHKCKLISRRKDMKKRLLSAFMALALCLTLLPAPARAEGTEGGAAQIGNTVYSTLPEAVDAAQDGDTIKLLADYKTAEGAGEEEESGLTITKSVTLDLNGYGMDDFRVAQVNDAGETLPSGNLTVEDTSAEKTGKVTGMIELLAGKLTINGGTIGDGRDGVSIENGNLIVNGGTIDFLYGSNSGTVTITGGIVKNARFGEGFNITVTGGSGHTGLWDVSEGTWNISGGAFEGVKFLTGSSAENLHITGGTFGEITRKILRDSIEALAPISGLLADGYAFYQKTDSEEYDQCVKLTDAIAYLENVQVKGHTHNFVNGVCTVCDYACLHTNMNGDGFCSDCNTQMVAKVEVGDTVTYSADFKEAMKNAANGTKITLLADVSIAGRTGISGDNTTVTLDLNEHKITSGWLDVGGKDTNGTYTTCTLKIIGKGSYEPPMYGGIITVDLKATLDLSEWEGGTISSINISDNSNYEAATREAAVIVGPKAGTIGKLTFGNNQLGELKKTKLSGGSFNEIWAADFGPVKLGELLADGYAYQNEDGSYVKYETTLQGASIYNVKVVKCLHPNMKPDETGTATCEYCGKSGKFVASVDGNLYTDMNGAISYWLANGGTLKLYADYTAADGTWRIGSGSHTVNLNGHKMSVKDDGAFKPTNNMHLTVTDGTERGQITNILLDGSQHGSFTLESGYVCNLKMTDGAVVALKGGSVDKLDVQHCSANTNLSIQGGSLGKLNIEDWADGMHVSATSGSLGAYTLPSGKILADVLDHQYYATGTSLDKQEDAAAQKWEKFDIKQAPYDFGSTSKATAVPINGSIPFRVDSPSENVGVYDVKWYRRTTSGTEHMVQNRVARVNVNDTLDVFCVITGLDRPNGAMQWQVAVKDYTIKVVPAKLNDDQTVIRRKPDTGNTGNPADNRLVVTPSSSGAFSDVEYKFEVTYNRQPLKLGEDYTIKDSSNLAKNAGTHTLTIEGIGNYTGEKSVTWTLEPYELSVENFCHAQIHKTYDGTDAVTDSTNGIDALAGFMLDSKNPRNPILSTVDKLNLDKSDYELSNMKFDSAEAGDRTFTGTMTLKPDGNFVFAGGSRVMQIEYGSVSGQQVVFIDRATIAAPAAKALQVANNHAATYTVDLSALLPKLESPKEYGKVTYALDATMLASGYYAVGTATIENGKLILPVKAVETKETGSIGSVKVKVSTTNYLDFTLTINVNATNKIVPTGEPTLSTKTLTYGQALSAIKLSGTMKDDGKTVPGMFAWVDGTVKPEVGSGTYEAAWKFTPTDGDTYAEADGTVTITVNKATPTGTPKYTAISKEGQTLADANLTAAGENKESLFKSLGTAIQGIVKWVESEDKTTALNLGTKVEQGKAYTWLFTPNDLANYNKLTGTIVLWAKPTSGGGGGVVTPAPTPSDADVITVKEDTKDNTTSKPGAETDTTITTKTTVKHTTTETTKNEQGQDVSKTTASVSKDLGDKLLDQAVSNKSNMIEITVKSSDANNNGGTGASAADSVKATEVELPKATVNAIAKDTNADLVIKTDNGEVVLDNKTLETIAGAAKGDTVTIVVGENTQLKETQKPAEKIVGKNGTLFELVAKIGEKHLHQFEGGKAYVTLPMPDKLKGKDVLVLYIDDNGLCKILNHSVEKIGAEYYIRFTTTHFSTFAVVDKDEAERLIKEQNAAHVKELMKSAKFKVTTTKTSKKSVKVQVAAKSSKTMISDIKSLGYTVKYQFYRSTKKTAGYKLLKTSSKNSFISTKGTKGRKYYYKARVLVYDGSKLVARSALKQCSYGARR